MADGAEDRFWHEQNLKLAEKMEERERRDRSAALTLRASTLKTVLEQVWTPPPTLFSALTGRLRF